MVTIIPELLADLRKKAEEAAAPHMSIGPGADYYAAVPPAVVLAILAKLKEWEAYEDDVMKAQNDAGMSPRRANEAIKVLLDQIEALETQIATANDRHMEEKRKRQAAEEQVAEIRTFVESLHGQKDAAVLNQRVWHFLNPNPGPSRLSDPDPDEEGEHA